MNFGKSMMGSDKELRLNNCTRQDAKLLHTHHHCYTVWQCKAENQYDLW